MGSNSSGNSQSFYEWTRETFDLFLMRMRGLRHKDNEMEGVIRRISELSHEYNQITDKQLIEAKILEIGYGARPIQMFALLSLGYSVEGIDLDRPSIRFSVINIFRIFLENGLRRALKTAIRGALFDAPERRALARQLAKENRRLVIDETAFKVGNATELEEGNHYDLIYSDNVFEHIPENEIGRLCEKISRLLSDQGIAIIIPDVFTGIGGGHLTEWYPATLTENHLVRRSEPWEHLRKKRFEADCYLNKLRPKQYEEIFSNYFSIVRIDQLASGNEKAFLTDELQAELREYSKDELLSGRIRYILRKSH